RRDAYCARPSLIHTRGQTPYFLCRIHGSTPGVVTLVMKLVFLLLSLTGAFCYLPSGKDNFLSGIFLRDLVNRINGKGISEGDGVSYLDFTDGLPLDARSLTRDLEEEQMFPLDYDGMGELNLHPSIRDQEYLQHSSLWGKQYMSGGAGEGNQLLRPEGLKTRQEIKTDSTLPAYCNPPNPCPVGYTEEQGCIMDFENSAAYSRHYQAAQDCMCDTEHMFDCPNPNGSIVDDPMESMDDMEFNRFLQTSIKLNQMFPNKNLVAKKYHSSEKSKMANPFLSGEKLPVAAKKGNNVAL
ncbi:hypothetical protein NQ318_017680, partial [Aromia moschata]